MSNRPIRRILPVLCGLLFLALSAQAATLKERFDKTVPLKGGSQVTLRNVNGFVKLEAWDRDEVRIEADKQVKAGTDSAARKFMDQVRIDITPGGGGLRIETHAPKRGAEGFWDAMFGNSINYHVNYTLHVPRQAAVDAESVNGGVSLAGTHGKVRLETTNGAVDVKDVTGDVNAGSTNGGISATHVAGAVKAETTNGAVDVDLTAFPAGSNLHFESTNGSVHVRLPRDARLSVDAETTNGHVKSDFEVAGGKPGKHSLKGDINGGGGQLKIRTTNGGIEIVH
jgi:putative adhesin